MRFAPAHDRDSSSADQQTLVRNLVHILKDGMNYNKFAGIVALNHRRMEEKVDVLYQLNPSAEGVLRG